jgi:hypothetical protein
MQPGSFRQLQAAGVDPPALQRMTRRLAYPRTCCILPQGSANAAPFKFCIFSPLGLRFSPLVCTFLLSCTFLLKFAFSHKLVVSTVLLWLPFAPFFFGLYFSPFGCIFLL